MSAAAVTVAPGLALSRGRNWISAAFVLADVVALEACLLLGCLMRRLVPLPIALGPQQFRGLALGILALPLVYALNGFYPGYGVNPVERLRSRFRTTLAVFALLIAWDYLVQDRQWSRGVLLSTVSFALFLPAIVDEMVRHRLAAAGVYRLPVMILGAGETGRLVTYLLRSNPSLGLFPAVILDDDPRKAGMLIDGLRVAGALSEAHRFAGAIRAAIVAIPGVDGRRASEIMRALNLPQVILIPTLFGMQSLWVTARDIGGVIGLEVRRSVAEHRSIVAKRVLDLVIGVPLLLVALPII